MFEVARNSGEFEQVDLLSSATDVSGVKLIVKDTIKGEKTFWCHFVKLFSLSTHADKIAVVVRISVVQD